MPDHRPKSCRKYRACITFNVFVDKTSDNEADNETAKKELNNRIEKIGIDEDGFAQDVKIRWLSERIQGSLATQVIIDNEG